MTKPVIIGALFILIGVVFFLLSFSYATGTLSSMGPGYFPKVLSLILISLGIVKIIKNDR